MVERWKQTENFAMKNHSDILWQCKKCWEMCKTPCENTRARTRTNLHLWRQAIYVHGMAPLFIQSTYSYIEFHILLLLLTHKHLSLLKQLIASEAEGGGKATPHVLLLQPSQTWVISHPKWWIVFFLLLRLRLALSSYVRRHIPTHHFVMWIGSCLNYWMRCDKELKEKE